MKYLALCVCALFALSASAQFDPPVNNSANNAGQCVDKSQALSTCQDFLNYTLYLSDSTTMETINNETSGTFDQIATIASQFTSCVDRLKRLYCGDAFRKCENVTYTNNVSVTTSVDLPGGVCRAVCTAFTDSVCSDVLSEAGLDSLMPDCTQQIDGYDRYPVDGYNMTSDVAGTQFVPCFYPAAKDCPFAFDPTCSASDVEAMGAMETVVAFLAN